MGTINGGVLGGFNGKVSKPSRVRLRHIKK
jgi:hypothetical protein